MKHAILVQAESQVLGIYSNLKAFWESLDNRDSLQHYATVSSYLRYGKSYDVGQAVIAGKHYEGVKVRKVSINSPLI